MATKIDIAGTNISASQMSEFYRLAALQGSHINRTSFQAYLERRSPFAFERNENGHIVFTIIGLDITGAEEIKRIEAAGYRISNWAKSCLTSTKADGYDKNHRLVAEKEYKIVLIPGKEIEKDSDRTTKDLQKLAEKYGYGKPLAGIVPRVRESISDKQMEEMGIWYIAALHDPITDSDGSPSVLGSDRRDDGRWLDGCWDNPDSEWDGDGAFAFLLPAS